MANDMNTIERLRALGRRREAEGIYTDQNICEAAIAECEELAAALRKCLPLIVGEVPMDVVALLAKLECDK